MRLARIIPVAAAVSFGWLMFVAAALACGGDETGPVVQHGRSHDGQRWSQLACLVGKDVIDEEISLPGPGGTDGGGGMTRPLPTATHSVYVDAPGTHMGFHGKEDQIDGIAFRATVSLKLYYRSGAPRSTRTVLAPAAERRRFRYLRGLRFFVYFFVDPRGLPQRVCGFDDDGRRTSCDRVLGQ